jgi:hypothetical protein
MWPQPSEIEPQVAPSAAQVVGVQQASVSAWQTSLALGQQLGTLPEQKTPLLHVQAPSTQSGATLFPTQDRQVPPPAPHTAGVSPA